MLSGMRAILFFLCLSRCPETCGDVDEIFVLTFDYDVLLSWWQGSGICIV